MSNLITQQPKRLFAFGCSFTNYAWPCWPEIIAYDLNVPYYNYGKPGSGNPYIFNTVMQADNYFNFNKDDLIMICWSDTNREDFYKNNTWLNISRVKEIGIVDNGVFSEDSSTINLSDPEGMLLRDCALIKATAEFLKTKHSQYHFLKMQDFDVHPSTMMMMPNPIEYSDYFKKVLEDYEPYLSQIKKSFYSVLWNNCIEQRIKREIELFGVDFFDGHPDIEESLLYLQQVFTHSFSNETIQQVQDTHKKIIDRIQKYRKSQNSSISCFSLFARAMQRFENKTFTAEEIDFSDLYFVKSQPIKLITIN